MKKYKMAYKCRTCGEVFTMTQTKNEQIAFSTINLITSGMDLITHFGNPVSSKEMHVASDHYGVADIIGCMIEEEKENEMA